MEESRDKVTVIITTYKSENIIDKCLKSVNSNYKKIIIENSGNSSVKEKLEKNYENLKVILSSNIGFGSAVNIGVENSKTEYAFSINPDVMIENDTIEKLYKSAKELKENFSILAPQTGRLIEEKPISVDKVRGHSLFINKKKFKNIGGFDENFFIYYEEDDLCKRFKKLNEKIYIIPSAKVSHIGGGSHNKEFNEKMEISRNWHLMWSLFYYHKKHSNYILAYIITLPFLLRSIFKSAFFFFIDKNKSLKYRARLSGLVNSYLGKKSFHRP